VSAVIGLSLRCAAASIRGVALNPDRAGRRDV
jgi:hypothetical protein